MDHHKRAVNKFSGEDKFFSAIGRFFFEFSQLEQTLKHHVAEQVSLEEQYQDLIMMHDFSLLCTIAEKVLIEPNQRADLRKVEDGPSIAISEKFKVSFDKEKAEKLKRTKKLQSLIRECKAFGNDRNAIAHGLCWTEERGGKVHHISRQLTSKLRDADNIASMADRLCLLRNEIDRMLPVF
jgi:hypothetical protein